MSGEVRPIIRESGRWYTRTGVPVTEVDSADKARRVRATVTHARKLGLLPSVTSIIRMLDKPGLRAWRDQQLVEAALSLPRPAGLSSEAWNDPKERAALILADAQAQVEAAADKGKDWHGLIEESLLGRWTVPLDETQAAVMQQIRDWLAQELGVGYSVVVERTVLGDGFCGTPDIVAQDRDLTKTLLADIKTVADTAPVLRKAAPYDEWQYQIAAYWRTTTAEEMNCWQIILGRESGALRFYRWSAYEIRIGWKAFSLLRQLWTIRNSYDPITWVNKKED